MIASRYNEILNSVEPYLIGNPSSFENYNLNALGKKILPTNLMSCLKTETLDFFKLVHKLDAITFGDQGMGMDKWVFFDCSAMPAGIFGFAISKNKAPKSLINLFNISDDYVGLIPITMYMAIPTSHKGRWFGHNLSSLGKELDQSFKGLGLLTKAYACQVFRIEQCYGATQWGSPALEIHTQLSDMKLEASFLPVHTHKHSLCYLSDYSSENIKIALSGNKREASQYDFLLESTDHNRQIELQKEIEIGSKFSIVGRPIHKDDKIFYPIRAI